MSLSDFQKECLRKVREYWNIIPKTESGITRWQLMPTKVALIVDIFKQSKLSAEEFTNELKLTTGLIGKFAKGKLPDGKAWPELVAALHPEKIKEDKENSSEELERKEVLVKKEILKILNRDQIKDIGLRDETITAEISSYPQRFVLTTLNRLVKEGKLESFKSKDKKYKKYRMRKSSDVNFRKEWKRQVVALLEETGLGKSRGLTPREIRETTKLDEESLTRELLSELVVEKLIMSTGETKGKRFVIARLQKEAEALLHSEKEKMFQAYNSSKLARENQEPLKDAKPNEVVEVKSEVVEVVDVKPEVRQLTAFDQFKEGLGVPSKEKIHFSSLEKLLAKQAKEDVIRVIQELPTTSFGSLINQLAEAKCTKMLEVFYTLSLSDFQLNPSV